MVCDDNLSDSAQLERYVYIVDDDVTFPVSAIEFYLKQMRKQQG